MNHFIDQARVPVTRLLPNNQGNAQLALQAYAISIQERQTRVHQRHCAYPAFHLALLRINWQILGKKKALQLTHHP